MRKKLCTIIGVLLILYVTAINSMSSTNIAFSLPVIILGIIIILYGFLHEKIHEYINKNNYLKKVSMFIKICVIAFGVIFVIVEGIIIAYPKHNKSDCDYIMVLGAGLTNGNTPSLTLAYRLDAAMEYFQYSGENKKIIVTGGKGSDEKIPEGEAMKNYLIEHGISEEMILVEDKSATTYENFKLSKNIIEKDSGKAIEDLNVKIVTTDFHAFRSRILAKKNGYEEVTNYSGKTVWYIAPMNYLREFFALGKTIIFD